MLRSCSPIEDITALQKASTPKNRCALVFIQLVWLVHRVSCHKFCCRRSTDAPPQHAMYKARQVLHTTDSSLNHLASLTLRRNLRPQMVLLAPVDHETSASPDRHIFFPHLPFVLVFFVCVDGYLRSDTPANSGAVAFDISHS